MIASLLLIFLNSFLSAKIIVNKADMEQINHNYKSAVFFYNIAYSYYCLNHFSQENKHLYLKIPYEIALCELKQKNNQKSSKILSVASSKIIKQYGYYSRENADFIREYLVEYSLSTNNINTARQELINSFTIYRKIGFNQNIMADLLRLNGDIFDLQKNYQKAAYLYEKAYSMINREPEIDYEIYTNIIHKMADCEVKQGHIENAIDIYKNTLHILQGSKRNENEAIAKIQLNLGDLYVKNELSYSGAIDAYENTINIVKTLPKTSYLRKNIYTYYEKLKDLYTKNNQSYKATDIDLELARRRRFAFFFD